MKGTKKERIQTVVIAILSVIIVFGGAYFASELKYCSTPEQKVGELEQIGMTEFTTLLNDDSASVIYIARPTCSYCQQQEPIVKEIVGENEGLPIFYLNTDNLTSDEMSKLFKTDKELFGEDGKDFGTPTTIIVQKGKVVDSIVGLTDKDNYVSFLQRHGFIK